MKILTVITLVLSFVVVACAGGPPQATSLRDAFAKDFFIGTALSRNQIETNKNGILEFAAMQFSAVTAENAMKWEKLNPSEGRYEFGVADRFLRFAQMHDIHLTGHTLVWHQQTPDWVFEDENGRTASRELLLSRLENHIKTVVGRYRGSIPSWDVVNEALNEDGSMRESKWKRIIGEDFVAKAFELAHKADPAARLYYNDYNLFKSEKRAGVIRLIKSLQKQGIPVHGIGMQGHYSLDFPAELGQIEDSIKEFSKLGVTVMITELDLSVLPFPEDGSEGADLNIDLALNKKFNPYADGLPREIEKKQEERYLDIFRIFMRNSDKISRVTFWGVNDGHSWRNNWPMKGRTDYPLLFDRENRPKKALLEILRMRQEMN